MCGSSENHKNCCCRGLKGIIEPRILMRIARKPMYGYELLESLSEMDHPGPPDPGGLYRLLRSMEQDGMLISQWHTNESGPAKRVYEITEDGYLKLKNWMHTLTETSAWLTQFLDEYQELLKTEILPE